jgi:SAM-dependent methyltransferase
MAPRASARLHSLSEQLHHLLGFRQTLTIDGARIRERTAEPLPHALSMKGPGRKDYDVVFSDGHSLRISATARRIYADLAGPLLLPIYQRASDWVTPGLRVLLLEGGTGYAARWVADQVGPSGAVVSLDRDEESIAFAKRRYRLPNVAFEVGSHDSLAGETNGAFDAVFSVGASSGPVDHRIVVTELWRIVGPEGWLFVAIPAESDKPGRASPLSDLRSLLSEVCTPSPDDPTAPATEIAADLRDGWIVAIARRPEPSRG